MNATQSILAGVIALGLVSATTLAAAAKGDNEKCAGVVKAGKNDCGTASSACAGTSKTDGQADAWIYVPTGTCDRIVGGMVTNKPENTKGGALALKK